jgi:hypothetical protein
MDKYTAPPFAVSRRVGRRSLKRRARNNRTWRHHAFSRPSDARYPTHNFGHGARIRRLTLFASTNWSGRHYSGKADTLICDVANDMVPVTRE